MLFSISFKNLIYFVRKKKKKKKHLLIYHFVFLKRNLQVSEATKNLWRDFIKMKSKIISTAKFSHNDGVIIHSLKFMEVIILAFTARDPQTPSFQNESLFSVEMIPSQHPFLSRPQLEREGEELLHTLVSWLEQIGNW